MSVFILLVVIVVVRSLDDATPTCKNGQTNTPIYRQRGSNNANSYYFVPETFGANLEDKCKPIASNTEYRNTVQNRLTCKGQWCESGKYTCRGDPNCYQVEHIIDSENSDPELAACSKNIYGNLVMAYGLWNNQVGQLCWEHVAAEKSKVYGSIFAQARANVKSCCAGYTLWGWFTDILISFVLPAAGVIAGVIVLYLVVYYGLKYYRERAREHSGSDRASTTHVDLEEMAISDDDETLAPDEYLSPHAFDPTTAAQEGV